MPYLNLKLSAAPGPGQATRIARLLTDLTADVLGKKRELIALSLEHAAPGHWFVGGESLTAGRATFFLEVKVTDGTNAVEQKAAYIEQVFAGMQAILGPLAAASYIVVDEVRADAWGYQGVTQQSRHGRRKPAALIDNLARSPT